VLALASSDDMVLNSAYIDILQLYTQYISTRIILTKLVYHVHALVESSHDDFVVTQYIVSPAVYENVFSNLI